jgi:hypothetical protein
MAGILTVQTIQGPTSGANANKVIIPAGQTLDASAGGLIPSVDGVVQVKVGQTRTSTESSSTSFISTPLSVTITPKYADSIIRLDVMSSGYYTSDAAAQIYIYGTIYRNGSNIGVGGTSTLGLFGAHGNNNNYARPFVFGTEDTPNTTSSVTYQMYMRVNTGTYTGGVNDGRFVNTITATEIKQ